MDEQTPTGESLSGFIRTFSTWADVYDGLDLGEVIHIPRDTLTDPAEAGFVRAREPHPLFATASYRDERATRSLYVVVYDDYYKVTIHRHNPDAGGVHALKHAFSDRLGKTMLALGGGYLAYHEFAEHNQH